MTAQDDALIDAVLNETRHLVGVTENIRASLDANHTEAPRVQDALVRDVCEAIDVMVDDLNDVLQVKVTELEDAVQHRPNLTLLDVFGVKVGGCWHQGQWMLGSVGVRSGSVGVRSGSVGVRSGSVGVGVSGVGVGQGQWSRGSMGIEGQA